MAGRDGGEEEDRVEGGGDRSGWERGIEVGGDMDGRLLYCYIEARNGGLSVPSTDVGVRVPAAEARHAPSFDAGLHRAWPRCVSLPILPTLPHHTITSHPNPPSQHRVLAKSNTTVLILSNHHAETLPMPTNTRTSALNTQSSSNSKVIDRSAESL